MEKGEWADLNYETTFRFNRVKTYLMYKLHYIRKNFHHR